MTKYNLKKTEQFNIKEQLNTDISLQEEYIKQVVFDFLNGDEDIEETIISLKPIIEIHGSIELFAKNIKIHKTTLYRILKNEITPQLPTFKKIVEGLGYKLEWNLKKVA
jgi:DNA-binding phage protein